ncbi:translocon subunit [Mucor velutinosus]|uniref:Translocon subunit n=1 Tax=Mucor velutinosus TaxID=708070 RepID=A0AAN7I3M3_9FUNG|nr:translocon subunit [Mucor velutinosus]
MPPTFLSLTSLAKKEPSTNRIRLAAVSNYKLAQMTFAPPDDRTLRKTALIKNLVEIVYKHTPNEQLTKHMVRWEYFTPESLEDMTQKDVEKIIYRYSQVVYSTAITLGKEGSKKEQRFLCSDYPEITAEVREMDEMSAYYASLFSSSVFSKDTLFQDEASSSYSESDIDMKDIDDKIPEKPMQPLPQPFQSKLQILSTSQPTYSSQRPNNSYDNSSNEKSTSRLSWLSDTGVPTNSAVALNLASEMMTLFDMEFNVDLSVLSLHELKKLESSNGSTTSLHKVFSANEYQSSEEDDNDYEEESGEEEDQQVVEGHQIDLPHLTAGKQRQQDHPQEKSGSKKKAFKLIPTLKQLGNRRNKSSSDESISFASLSIAPAAPTHSQYRAHPSPAHNSNHQYYYSSSLSSDSEQEEEKEEESDDDIPTQSVPYSCIGPNARSITPPNRTSSLDYRTSLRDRFKLSDKDSSETSSDYFNDSVDTFQVELNCSRDSAGVDSTSFKGFLSALSSIRKTRSRSNSTKQDSDGNYPTISSTQSIMKEESSFDSESMIYNDSKRKNSIQKVIKYLGTRSSYGNKTAFRRGSVTSSSLSVSATSTIMSGSSLFSEPHRTQAAKTSSSHTSPIILSPRVAKRHGVYTTSIISDTSSFNWAEETRQKDEFGSIHSKASSNKTMPAFFSSNKKQQQQQQCLARPSSTTSLGGFLKRLTAFSRKDKHLQRA